MIDIHDQTIVLPRGAVATPPRAVDRAAPASVSDKFKPARPFTCTGCGAVVRLTDQDPLPKGWSIRATVGLDRKLRNLRYRCRACSPPRQYKHPRRLKRGENPAWKRQHARRA